MHAGGEIAGGSVDTWIANPASGSQRQGHARGVGCWGGAGVGCWGCLPVKDQLAARAVGRLESGLDRVGVEVRVGLGVRVG